MKLPPEEVAGGSFAKGADYNQAERLSARRFVPLAIVLVPRALVPIIPLIFLGLNRIVAHPLRVISLLLIILTLLLVGHGLCTAHLELLSYL
jgi:hypothetical protein